MKRDPLARTSFDEASVRGFHELTVAAAMVTTGVLGAAAASSAAGKAEDAQNRATDAASKSASENAALGREQLDFAKQQYADLKPARDKALDTAQQTSEAQLAAMKENQALASDYAAYLKNTFRPLEQQIVADAQGYDTAGRRLQAANEASASVTRNFDTSMDGLNRTLQRQGFTPGSGRSLALMQDAALQKATATTGATNTAVKNVEQQGYARTMDAANLGRNLPSNQATSAQIANSMGNSAVGNAMSGLNGAQAGQAGLQASYNAAIGANQGAGQLYTSMAGTFGQQLGMANQAMGGFGSAMGRLYGSGKFPSMGTGGASFPAANDAFNLYQYGNTGSGD